MIRLFPVPYNHRHELDLIAHGMSREEYVDKIWQLRNEAFGPVKKSNRRKWPFERAPEPDEAKILLLPRRLRA